MTENQTENAGTELAQRIEHGQQADPIYQLMQGYKRQFERGLILPNGEPIIHPDKFLRVAISTVKSTPKLAQATEVSLLGALMTCSQLGLEPGGPLGHAYIVPYEDKKRKTIEATLIIGYRGYIDMMYRSDRVASVKAHAVYSTDTFDYELGTNEYIRHRPKHSADRGQLTHAYGIAELVTGAKPFDVLHRTDIDARRAQSRGSDSEHSPWNKHYEAMARKSAIRQLERWLPSSITWQAAAVADGRSFREIPDTLEDIEDAVIIEDDGGDE